MNRNEAIANELATSGLPLYAHSCVISLIGFPALSTIQEVLAILLKRFDRLSLEFLQREEVEAIITAPDKTTFSGHRDFVMFMTLYNTGARVSKIIRLQVGDACLESKALQKLQDPSLKSVRYQASDSILSFLESL